MKIGNNKVLEAKLAVAGTPDHLTKNRFIDAMAASNIPANYWFLKFSTFHGSEHIKKYTVAYVSDMKANFKKGEGLCFAGNLGTGKTMAICSILKTALKNSYTAYYTTLSDLPHYFMDRKYSDEYFDLCSRSDFLAIDEVDARHISSSEESNKLFATFFERIIRYRLQNSLPMLLGTNHPDLTGIFKGQHLKAIDSLLSQKIKLVPALGKDFRKKNDTI